MSYFAEVIYGPPQGHLSRGIATEYILRTTWWCWYTWYAGRREGERVEEGGRHEAHFPEEMAFMAFIAFTPFSQEVEAATTRHVGLWLASSN